MPKSHSTIEVTRLAPSPTGALHLGNARTFLVNWALARRSGWSIILRIEDLDSPRIKKWASEQAVEDLRWLGIDYDSGPVYQSHDLSPYREAMEYLVRKDLAFPCKLSRKEIEQALSAPHGGELRYDPSLRSLTGKISAANKTLTQNEFHPGESINWRFKTRDRVVSFQDCFAGKVEINPWAEVGDFVIWTKSGLPAYQLAVVIDDYNQNISQVVRGDDLLSSTGRQILLQEALGYTSKPTYTHLPLVSGPDGRRLAKRHGDTRIAFYREQGVSSSRIIGLIAYWCGICPQPVQMNSEEFAEELRLERIPHEPVTMTAEAEKWLQHGVW